MAAISRRSRWEWTANARQESGSRVKISHADINIDFDLSSVKKEIKHIHEITISNGKIELFEKFSKNSTKEKGIDRKFENSAYGGKFLESLAPLLIGRITLDNEELNYNLDVLGKNGQIKVSDIHAVISQLGSRKEIGERFVFSHLRGRVQKTGEVIFIWKSDLFSIKNEDHLDIEVKNQKMSELDTFFSAEDGINFEGTLDSAHAIWDLSQGVMKGEITTKFHGLQIKLHPTKVVSGFTAFVCNIFTRIKFAETKPAPGTSSNVAPISHSRKGDESVIKFFLAGLKEAAFKAASK